MAPFPFLRVPPEIRERIYDLVLVPTFVEEDNCFTHQYHLALLRANRQVHDEAGDLFRRRHVFARVQTPVSAVRHVLFPAPPRSSLLIPWRPQQWPEAQHHIAVEGHVALVAIGPRANAFTHHHLTVQIDAPDYLGLSPDSYKVVVRLADLDAFAMMWYYSDLSHPGLNAHLRLTLRLRDPDPAGGEPRLGEALQRQLLLPFGRVKGLSEVRVEGAHADSLEREMRAAMAEPYRSPEECLEECTRIKDEGNEWLGKKEYERAIGCYERAFAAIHIIVHGRRRDVWGEVYFRQELTTGRYRGQYGHQVSLDLRVKLVANVVLAFSKLDNYDMAFHWGMRSINLMRDTIGDGGGDPDEPVMGFSAADALGKIYFCTGVAAKRLGHESDARQLLRAARTYLPNDEMVQKEAASVALRLA